MPPSQSRMRNLLRERFSSDRVPVQGRPARPARWRFPQTCPISGTRRRLSAPWSTSQPRPRPLNQNPPPAS